MSHGTSVSIFLEKPWIGGGSVGSWVDRRAPQVPQIRHRLADFDQRFAANQRGASGSFSHATNSKSLSIHRLASSQSPIPGFPVPFEIGLQFTSFGFCDLPPRQVAGRTQ